jgi:hypothetical protein
MRLLLIGTIGDSKFVSNLGAEVEIKVLDIKNNSVLFSVSSKKQTAEQMYEKAEYRSAVSDIPDLAFLRRQAD